MALALLTRTDASLASEWSGRAPVEYGYEVLLVCDTSGASPGNPWAVFCPALDVASAGSDPKDALNMIADAIYEALADGVYAVSDQNYDKTMEFCRELREAGFPTAEAVVCPAPYSRQ